MDVAKITVECALKGGLSSSVCDGVQHIKVLPYLSVVQAIEGSYDIQLGDCVTCNTGHGGFFVAPANVQQRIVHNSDKTTGHMLCRWIFLKININDLYSFDDLYSFPTIIPEPYKAQMNQIFDRLFSCTDKFDEHVCYYETARLLSLMADKKDFHLPSFLDCALDYIKSNYKEKITVEDIAKRTNISASYLFSAFKNKMGVSPISYLNGYRLSVAAGLLLGTDKTITEISAETGICDPIYFNKIFKKYYQTSPREYRKLYRAEVP